MNGKQCRILRKQLSIKKPTASIGGYVYFDLVEWEWMWRPRHNPVMNIYRKVKRFYKRGY